jgi:SAM-dependent methyltransferase
MPDNIYGRSAWVDKFMFSEPHSPYDEERVAGIAGMVPQGVGTVLDVGIGGGYIYKRLEREKPVKCYGLDISFELARRLEGLRVCVGDAGALPFRDGQFDLVLAADVIEHIGEGSFGTVISEIARVSKEYIIINSPYKDSIHWPVSLCGRCRKEFNIYGHMRRIDMALIRRAFPKEDFEILKTELSGPRRGLRPRPLVYAARRWGKVYSEEGTVCPHCYNTGITGPERSPARRCMGGAVCALFALIDGLAPPLAKAKSEIRVLIRKRRGAAHGIR